MEDGKWVQVPCQYPRCDKAVGYYGGYCWEHHSKLAAYQGWLDVHGRYLDTDPGGHA